MNSQVCVNCRNEKPVNCTDNRLVTESCGHVKCMDCLLQEKAGCIACLSEKSRAESTEVSEPDDGFAGDSVLAPTYPDVILTTPYEYPDADDKDIVRVEDLSKKKKLETSHIRIDSDGSGKKFYVCMVCKKRFRARSQVAYHAYCNGQSKPYECLQCEEKKTFASHSHYKYHMRVHRNERTYPCDICGQGFFQMSKLRRHKLKHTQAKEHVCSQCNKAFNNEASLRKHTLTHTGERPHACPACGRRFRDTSNLSKHFKKKHNPEKCSCKKCGAAECAGRCGAGAGAGRRHQCARCPQAFHSSKDLRRHAAVHTDSKPFRCKVCAKNFRRKDNLERHIRNTHPQHAPAAAVECDETALKEICNNAAPAAHVTPVAPAPLAPPAPPTNGHRYESEQKIKLEILNPLPPLPLPQDMFAENGWKPEIDSSFIISANNARQSVIVGKKSAVLEKPPESPECEYVHKIRKANCHNISLPPIDANKFAELDRQTNMDTLRVEEPPRDDKIFKKILCDDGEVKETEASAEPSPQVHWRKLKLNSN